MDVAATAKIIQSGDVVAIALTMFVAVPAATKAVYALIIGRHQRRKEFLEFWKEVGLRDDTLWLEETFRHRYGAELSAPLIKHVLSLTHPSAKLRRLAAVSDLFELDAALSLVAWTRPHRERLRWLALEVVISGVLYFLFACAGVLLVLQAWKLRSFDSVAPAFFGLVLLGVAITALLHAMSLPEARSTLAFVNDRPNPTFLQDMERVWGWAWSAIERGFGKLKSLRGR